MKEEAFQSRWRRQERVGQLLAGGYKEAPSDGRPLGAQTEHVSVYMLRKQAKSDSFLLAGKAFTAYYGIPTGEARRYVAKDFGDGVLGAELGGEYTDASREESDVVESAPEPETSEPEIEDQQPMLLPRPAVPPPAKKVVMLPLPPKYGGR